MLLWMEGFDYYGTGGSIGANYSRNNYVSFAGSSPLIESFTSRGSATNSSGATGSLVLTPLSEFHSTVITGFGINFEALPTTEDTFFDVKYSPNGSLISSTTSGSVSTQLVLSITDSAKIRLRNGSGTILSTGSTLIKTNAWYFFELKATLASSGSYEFRINGETEFSGTAQTIRTGNPELWDSVFFNGLVGGNNIRFDDWYLCDDSGILNNDFLDDIVVETKVPDADSVINFTPNSGLTNFDKIDETTPDTDTTYVSSNILNDKDLYTVQNVSDITTIKGVSQNVMHRKEVGGSRQIELIIKSNVDSNEYNVKNSICLDNYIITKTVNEVDPGSNDSWTTTNFNDTEFGFKVLT